MIEHTETDGTDDIGPHVIATSYIDGIGWLGLGELWTTDAASVDELAPTAER